MEEYINNVLDSVKAEMQRTDSKDTIHKLYRQARVWVRFQCYYAKAFSLEESSIVNKKLKKIHKDRLNQLSQQQ